MALSGGTGQKAGNFLLNRATGTKRPPGSSIKPIAIYGPAVEYGLITPSTLVLDAKSDIIHLSGTSWYPKNSGGGNAGIITIAEGLRRSLNTVSAQILDKLTPQASYEFLINRLGVTSLVTADCDYAPLALGQLTNGITVREMAQAYSALDNDGVFTYSRTYSKVTQGSGSNEKVILQNDPVTIQAFSANTAHVMTYMLQNAAHYGTGSEAWLGNNVMVDTSQYSRIADLVTVQVQNGKHGAIGNWIEELIRLPRSCQRTGFRFAVAHDAGRNQVWIVENCSEGMFNVCAMLFSETAFINSSLVSACFRPYTISAFSRASNTYHSSFLPFFSPLDLA